MEDTGNIRQYKRASIVFLQDFSISVLASFLALMLVRWLSEPIPGFIAMVFIWLGVSAVATAAGLLITSSYREVRRFTTLRSMAKTTITVLLKEALVSVALIFGIVHLPLTGAIIAIMADAILTIGFLLYLRLSARLLLREKSEDILVKASRRRALVYGTNEASLLMAEELGSEGYDVVGFITADPALSGRVIRDHVIYCCRTDEDMSRLQWQLGGVDGLFFPKTDLSFDPSKPVGLEEVPQRDGMTLLGHALKRSFDIGLSALLLLVFSPVIAICAILIKREDGGPVIYAQERIGRGGQPFNIYKFRSMRMDAEADGVPALYAGEEDPRLTRIGRFLRAHHLDELPQLWNVLRGDMSFIGYRPERQFYIDKIMACNARYRYLYQIRPGVTSYATLYNGYTDSLEKMLDRLDLDLYYLRNHSVWFDIKVLGLTFLSIVSGKKF